MHRGILSFTTVGVLLLAACGSTDDGDDATAATDAASDTDTDTDGDAADTDGDAADDAAAESGDASSGVPFAVDQIESSPRNVTASGLDAWNARAVPESVPAPLVDFAEIRSGGPPPDGIPPVDEPRFLQPADVDFLAENEPVLALEIDGDARAYPVQILTWHEIVNDTVGGVPVSVTYCPLCNSAVAYDRRLGDQILDFGTSGLLWNSALVMYDRQTETLWSHFTGEGIIGELTGQALDDFPLATVAWSTWRDANPDGLVLSRETGFSRQYGANPYPGYDNVDGVPFLFEGEVDGRYTALTRIVGVERDGEALGIPLIDLQAQQVVAAEFDGSPLVAWWTDGVASALDTSAISQGQDVGATGVFVPVVDGTELTFTPNGDGFVDDQTGSTWNVLGDAVDGPLTGSELEALSHVDTFWFAWSTFRPDTVVVTE
ncbi:MAG: DUF3179 domain-containing protein [Ilumatobacter sp.]|uniref:DUF3179 domain-containing protein n=1 Tax=Ilumatobacter sp. TaxID=1967498 RepID=UPI002636C927|nr:DUF3179 domain-containing protein [Ilumatobacter sp.]MDJ0768240.1 DUF3179 domain-containing protein [Ilumatobacter sp.]